MNSVAKSFRQLVEVLAHEPESASVEPMLAEVAARVGATGHIICAGLQTRKSRYWPLGETAALLRPYGVVLKTRTRRQRDGLYLFAGGVDETPPPLAGARVLERVTVWEQAA